MTLFAGLTDHLISASTPGL